MKYTSKNDEQELELQQEYMEKASRYVTRLAEELGRTPLCCVTTFGCQMNTVHGIIKAAYKRLFSLGQKNIRAKGRNGQDGAAGHADGAFYAAS